MTVKKILWGLGIVGVAAVVMAAVVAAQHDMPPDRALPFVVFVPLFLVAAVAVMLFARLGVARVAGERRAAQVFGLVTAAFAVYRIHEHGLHVDGVFLAFLGLFALVAGAKGVRALRAMYRSPRTVR